MKIKLLKNGFNANVKWREKPVTSHILLRRFNYFNMCYPLSKHVLNSSVSHDWQREKLN